ncbi:hypothetical protein CR513_17410, partial [Mucuna pruriens]
MAEIDVEGLFSYAMNGQWREALEAYKKNPGALEAKITKAEDTVLHIAAYVGQTSFVTNVLDNISEEVCLNILQMHNTKGNTPLHLAAQLGNVDICHNIAKRDPNNLISCRNFDGETPLFLAAVHGNGDAFFCLHRHRQSCNDNDDNNNSQLARKSNGDTILHSTIASEYFGLALQIIKLYPNLVDTVNQDGLSPLQVLAGKPNCFKSSTRMELLQRIIEQPHFAFCSSMLLNFLQKAYNIRKWIFYLQLILHNFLPKTYNIQKLIFYLQLILHSIPKVLPPNFSVSLRRSSIYFLWEIKIPCLGYATSIPRNTKIGSMVDEFEKTDARYNEADTHDHYPMNYETCATFVSLLKGTAIGNEKATNNDEENNVSRKSDEEQAKKEKKRCPPNWEVAIRFLNHMMKVLLIICGVGTSWTGKIQRKKVKHILAKKVMNELIQRTSSLYKHEYGGMSVDDDNKSREKKNNSNNNEKGGFEKMNRRRDKSAILIAAKMGVTEMVEKILDTNPVAIHD